MAKSKKENFFKDKCYLNKVFGKTSIRNQIWIGFVLILAILLAVSLSTLSAFVNLNNGIYDVTEELQPVVLAAQNLETELESSSNALGSYLLTKEDAYRESYVDHMAKAVSQAAKLSGFKFVREEQAYISTVEEVKSNLTKLADYESRMVELVNNNIENIPAQRIATEKLNPMVQQLQSMISQMIISDYEEDNAGGERDEFRQALYDLRYYNVQTTSELRTFLAFRSDANVKNMESIREVVTSKLELIRSSEDLYSFEQAELVDEFIGVNEAYTAALSETVVIHSSEKYRTDIYLIKTEIGPLVAEIESDIGILVDQLKRLITNTSDDLQKQASGASAKVLSGVVFGIVLGFIIAIFMARMIVIPIKAAVNAMEDLAEGEGDLTRRLDDSGKSEIAMMAKSFNKFAGKVQELVARVAASVDNLSLVVNDVSTIVDQTQNGAQLQREQTAHVATSIEEMTVSVQDVATNANLAAESARQADENAKSGQIIVDETISSIKLLADEIDTGVNVINALSKDTESIGSVLDVIKGIAEQTNLLALNAAIEAARAGEQGRGFAVVADEVRTLASRTQESTTEIEAMIENLQVQAHAAVDAIAQGEEKARASVDNASSAGDALNQITQSVDNITSMNIQIAAASEQQSVVVGGINKNVVSISQVADKNEQASNQLTSSSEGLAELASELKHLVSQFKH